ncbi:MAG: dynamin family protein, partial [Nostoc sp.]
ISEAEKQKVLEKIGEASGRDVRIRLLSDQLIDLVFEQITESWDEWREGLGDRIAQKSQYWNSEHNPVSSQDKLIRDYTNQFIRDLSREIDEWGNTKLKEVILQENIKYLDTNIAYELDAIQGEFNSLDQNIQTNFSEQLKLSIDGINDDFMGMGGIGGGIGIGGALAAGLIVFTGLGFIAVIVASLAATIAGSFGFGMLDFDGLKDKIKGKVFELGFQKFDESMDKLSDKLDEIVGSVFENRVESASRVIAEAIALYENLLEQ